MTQVDKTKSSAAAESTAQPTPQPSPQPAAHEEHGVPMDLPKPKAMTILASVAILLALLGALFVLGWVPHSKQRDEAKSDAEEMGSQLPVVVVAPPRQAAPTSELSLPADVRAFQETAIFPRTSGYLKKLNVDIQSKVAEGQVLAEIESPEVDAQYEQAKGALEQAKAMVKRSQTEVDLTTRTVDRYHQLRDTGGNSVTQQELDEKESALRSAKGGLEMARANVVAAEATVQRWAVLQNFEKVTAPFSGIVTERHYDVGALLSATDTAPGKEMFHLAEIDKLRVFVSVPQGYASDIKIGGPAFLNVRNRPGINFEGVVARSAGAIDPLTRTMLFELHFPNPDNQLYAGMYGTAKLELSQAHPVLLVPTAALRFDAAGVQIATVRDGKVHLQKVEPGRDLGTELEIVAGLDGNEQVVTNPAERINEGSPVRVVAQAKTAQDQPTPKSHQVSVK